MRILVHLFLLIGLLAASRVADAQSIGFKVVLQNAQGRTNRTPLSFAPDLKVAKLYYSANHYDDTRLMSGMVRSGLIFPVSVGTVGAVSDVKTIKIAGRKYKMIRFTLKDGPGKGRSGWIWSDIVAGF